jgi:hypothetical protein
VITDVVVSVLRHVVVPVFIEIAKIVAKIFTVIPLPEHPIWFGVGVLGIAALTAKVAIPAFVALVTR